jgi:hypothetical protein
MQVLKDLVKAAPDSQPGTESAGRVHRRTQRDECFDRANQHCFLVWARFARMSEGVYELPKPSSEVVPQVTVWRCPDEPPVLL